MNMLNELPEQHQQTMKELKEAILNSSKETSIYVGCDSKRFRKGIVKYATVVILHKDSKHGGQIFSFIDKEKEYSKPEAPRLRLVTEAYKAVDIASHVMGVIGDRNFELHLDLNTNPKFKSNEAVKEALGYVLGVLGIEAKCKPAAWGASTAADRIAG